MNFKLIKRITLVILLACSMPAAAQFNFKKVIGGASKAVQAVTISDADMAAYVKEYIDWMDSHNKVCDEKSKYTIRLNKLTQGLSDVEGVKLNFKCITLLILMHLLVLMVALEYFLL